MKKDSFTQDDKERLVKFLNFLGTKAKFDGLSVQDVIDGYSHIAWAQTVLLKKVDAHIMEITRVIEDEPQEDNSQDQEAS